MNLNWKQIVQIIGPLVITLIAPKLQPVATDIVNGITQVEDIKGATGPVKRQKVQNITALAVDAVNSAQGKITVNPAVADATAGHVIDTIVDVSNLIQQKAEAAPAAPPAAQ